MHEMKFKKILSLLMALAMLLPSGLGALTSAAEETPLVEYVNTLIGTNSSATIAGPTRPNGSIHPSPETRSPKNGGYTSGQPVVGFGQLYAQGTGGTKSFGQFLISPQTGTLETSEANHASSVSNEKGAANYYSATLDKYNIKAEVAPTDNAAIYRFTYPENENASLLLDISRKIEDAVALRTGSINIDKDNKMITGGGTFRNNWNPADWNMYFALEFDKTPTEIGIWDSTGLKADTLTAATSANPNTSRLGAYLKFSTTANEVVNVKIAISFDSVEKAKSYLNTQIPAWDYEGVKNAGAAEWNDILGSVELGDAVTEAQKEKFYTALFHANVQPRDRTSDHGEWDDYYTIWDSWKTVFPFQTLVRPDMIADNINSFISRYNKTGYITDAFIQGKEFICGQGGNDIENIIADAYIKNVPGVNWEDAYAAVKGDSEAMRSPTYVTDGYQYGAKVAQNGMNYSGRLYPSSATMGFAYNDYAVAIMAKGLGKTADYTKYMARSNNWKNIWDSNLTGDGYKGFAHNKNAAGNFENPTINPTSGYDSHYYEASIWAGSYYPVFDVDSMVDLMGGKYMFANRLDFALSQGNNYINFGNEPAFQTIWLFSTPQIKRPDLASKWVNQFLARFPQNGYPGDEDNGAMSTIYMFMMSGFFPMSCTNTYYLHGTRLPEVTYNLGNGKKFTIKGINTSSSNIYVQSATLNGEPLDESWIDYDQIMAGGTLEFVMGSAPSRWGREPVDPNKRPTDVTNLKASTSGNSITLTWDESTDEEGISGYNVYRGFTEDFEPSLDNLVTTTSLTTHSEFPGYGIHYYKVLAENYSGNLSRNTPCEHAVLEYSGTIPARYNGSLMFGATGKVNAMASATENAQYAFDMNESTKWSCRILFPDLEETDKYPLGSMWLEVDLGRDCTVNKWLVFNEGASILTEFYLQKKDSPDGAWTNVRHIKDITNSNSVPFEETLETAVTGRYFRLLIPVQGDDQTTNNARIREFHLFGTSNSPAPKYPITLNPVVGGDVNVSISKNEAEYNEVITVDITDLPEGYVVKSINAAHSNGSISATRITEDLPENTARFTFKMPPRGVTISPVVAEDSDPPTAPGNVKAVNTLGLSKTTITWDASICDFGIEKYLIYRHMNPDFKISEESLIGETTTALTFTDFPEYSGTYFYKVAALSTDNKLSETMGCAYAVININTNAAYGTDTNTNIALGKEATANDATAPLANPSAVEFPRYTVDGLLNTKWSCRGNGTNQLDEFGNFWLEVDLGEAYMIDRWVVKHAGAGGEGASLNTRDFTLQAKFGNEWVDIDPVLGNSANITDRKVSQFSSQYVRLYITAPEQGSTSSNKGNARIYEFELYSPAKPNETYANSLTAFKNGKVHDQAGANEGAAQALDMNTGTKWSARVASPGVPDKTELDLYPLGSMWLEVDLGKIYNVGSWLVINEGTSVLKDFRIQVKNSEGNWDTFEHYKGSITGSTTLRENLDNAVTGRYFRLLIPVAGTNQSTDNARLREFHLFPADATEPVSNPVSVKTFGGNVLAVANKSSATPGETVLVEVSDIEEGKAVYSINAIHHDVKIPLTEVTEDVPAGKQIFSFVMPACPVNVELIIENELFFETKLTVDGKFMNSLSFAAGKSVTAEISAFNKTSVAVDVRIIAALYNKSGSLHSFKTSVETIPVDNDKIYKISLPVPADDGELNYKLFIWDKDKLTPLALIQGSSWTIST